MKTDIVIPTIRNLDNLKEWEHHFKDCHIIIVEDNKEKTVKYPKSLDVSHYCYSDVEKELKKDSWIIPYHTGAIRSLGFLKSEADVIISLDDDCYPCHDYFVQKHIKQLKNPSFLEYFNTFPIPPRGFPYHLKKASETVINHGLWEENPDLDAFTELAFNNAVCARTHDPIEASQQVPRGLLFSLCGMNVSFKKIIKPAMFFQGHYPRYDDIWAGFFSKKICDHLNLGVKSGSPLVRHSKKSNIYSNSVKEADGFIINEQLARDISGRDILGIQLESSTVEGCYLELAEKLPDYSPKFKKIKEAMQIWLRLGK